MNSTLATATADAIVFMFFFRLELPRVPKAAIGFLA